MERGARKKRVHVYVSGRVQGVFFRDSTRERARRLGVSGWVRNLPDGRVEAVFEGESGDVDEMVRWCHEGPPHARVESVEVEEEPVSKSSEGFEVR
ncbi:Acylphosphatase [Rubrobacter xylanophilus DSM 9941]|uniref:acylphosphatase n=1 Tax=Rubrobacter xylanophilus TaxID=49319 RepID=UPI001C640E4C|nr:acylphosphatase [Rubrobacter xylanophilus]QYJ16993.1 Acylphosphatase [Rubrobacter xylanophilus DSM 9941]